MARAADAKDTTVRVAAMQWQCSLLGDGKLARRCQRSQLPLQRAGACAAGAAGEMEAASGVLEIQVRCAPLCNGAGAVRSQWWQSAWEWDVFGPENMYSYADHLHQSVFMAWARGLDSALIWNRSKIFNVRLSEGAEKYGN